MMLTLAAIVIMVLTVAAVLWRAKISLIIVKDNGMSAALDRLTASVDAAIAKMAAAPVSDDDALNALADKLDAATTPPAPDTSGGSGVAQ